MSRNLVYGNDVHGVYSLDSVVIKEMFRNNIICANDFCMQQKQANHAGTYQRAPPHLWKWPRRLTRVFSGQLHLTRVMFSATSLQRLSPLGTTCAHAPMYMSFPRRTIVTSCPAFYTLTFIDCILIRLI